MELILLKNAVWSLGRLTGGSRKFSGVEVCVFHRTPSGPSPVCPGPSTVAHELLYSYNPQISLSGIFYVTLGWSIQIWICQWNIHERVWRGGRGVIASQRITFIFSGHWTPKKAIIKYISRTYTTQYSWQENCIQCWFNWIHSMGLVRAAKRVYNNETSLLFILVDTADQLQECIRTTGLLKNMP